MSFREEEQIVPANQANHPCHIAEVLVPCVFFVTLALEAWLFTVNGFSLLKIVTEDA